MPDPCVNIPGRCDVLERVLDLWRTEFADDSIGPDDDYFALGGDSLLALEILQQMRDHFPVSLSTSVLIKSPTPRTLAREIRQVLGAPPTTDPLAERPAHLIPLRVVPGATRPPIFCFHAADGGVMFYRTFIEQLPPDATAHAIESRLFHGDAPGVDDSIESLARRYLDDLRAVCPRGPYVLAGYSFGALVAQEAARLATEEGDEVAGLVIYDMLNPAAARMRRIPERLLVYWRQQADLPPPRRLVRMIRRVGSLAAWMLRHTSERIGLHRGHFDSEYRRHLLARRHHEELIKPFKPRRYSGRTLLVMTEDAGDKYDCGEWMGWKDLLTGEVSVRQVGGNHLQLFDAPQIDELVAHTRAFLDDLP